MSEIEMARRICARIAEGDSDSPLRVAKANRYYEGDLDHDHHMAIALAAIRETTEAAVKLAERWGGHVHVDALRRNHHLLPPQS